MQDSTESQVDSNIEARRGAVEQLRGLKDKSNIPVLLKAMEDHSWRVRKTALDILFEDHLLEDYIPGLIKLLYIEDNAGARNSAIEALIRLGKRATPFLIEAFGTQNKDVRKFVIDVLGELSDSRIIPLMLEAIKDEDDNVRATAVEHLGKIGEISVVDALIDILKSGDLWTSYPAADALGRIGNRKAVPHLVAALGNKPLREPVLKALGLLADPDTLRFVIPLLMDPSRSIQEHALRSLERYYHNGVSAEFMSEEMKKILGDKAVDLLIGHAWSSKREVRVAAIMLLGLMKDEAAYGPLLDISHEEEFAAEVRDAFVFIGHDRPESLLKLFETDDIHQVRFMCEVTERVESPVYYDVLFRMLDNDDGHVRSIAAISISKLRDHRALGKLKALLRDPYEDVQEAAVEALANLRDYLDPGEFIAMLKDQSPVLRRNAARLLGRIISADAVNDLGFAMKDDDIRVRRAVVRALSLIGTDEAVRYLTYALTDENPDIRISSVLSLGSIGREGTLEALTILASDPDASVRAASAKAMGLMGDAGAVKTLVGLLADRNGFVAATAIDSLGLLGGEEAKGAIVGMLASADEEIKRTALKALASFEDEEEHLIPFLRDPDWATRIAAIQALSRKTGANVRQEIEKLLDVEEDPTVIKAVEEVLRV